mgnify:CR=1 FL=1
MFHSINPITFIFVATQKIILSITIYNILIKETIIFLSILIVIYSWSLFHIIFNFAFINIPILIVNSINMHNTWIIFNISQKFSFNLLIYYEFFFCRSSWVVRRLLFFTSFWLFLLFVNCLCNKSSSIIIISWFWILHKVVIFNHKFRIKIFQFLLSFLLGHFPSIFIILNLDVHKKIFYLKLIIFYCLKSKININGKINKLDYQYYK